MESPVLMCKRRLSLIMSIVLYHVKPRTKASAPEAIHRVITPAINTAVSERYVDNIRDEPTATKG